MRDHLAHDVGQRFDGEEWDTLADHREEVTELYLGFAVDNADKAAIVSEAKAVNPGIKIFQMRWKGSGGLAWDAVK